jgi:glycerophosphoryl diester phosphodiesterase
MYQFPPGARLAPHDVLVVAASALSFQQEEGRAPDYEFYATDPTVPTLAPAPDWGEGEWELRQDGDQVLLLDDQNRPVDVVVYGDAAYPGVVPHPGVTLYTHSLERSPPESDTDDCSRDFRDWPFPNPGQRP